MPANYARDSKLTSKKKGVEEKAGTMFPESNGRR
jgi:hypothetical protein